MIVPIYPNQFQSTPPRGRRLYLLLRMHQVSHFNPRLREGGDSISLTVFSPSDRFQSTPPRGRRLASPAADGAAAIFQSTPPRGRRQKKSKIPENAHDFNPRLREGGDDIRLTAQDSYIDFNPRLREGGDSHVHTAAEFMINFNPRLREGGDVYFLDMDTAVEISIHASAREATALITKIHLKHHISFQHTVHKSPFNVNYPFQ